jgi:hypothetical protein
MTEDHQSRTDQSEPATDQSRLWGVIQFVIWGAGLYMTVYIARESLVADVPAQTVIWTFFSFALLIYAGVRWGPGLAKGGFM